MKSLLFIFVILLTLNNYSLAENSEEDIRNEIYTSYPNVGYCFRHLNLQGTSGCATSRKGDEGTLRYIVDEAALINFLRSPPSYQTALMIPQSLFNRSVVNQVRRAVNLAGILILPPASSPANGWSPEASKPQSSFALNQVAADFIWNPLGDGLTQEALDFAVIRVDQDAAQNLITRGLDNENRESSGRYPSHAVEFKYAMQADTSSTKCLDQGTCLPVGGYSVWWTVDDVQKSTKPIIMAVTRMDASAFFPYDIIGAESAMSGTISLMAAASAVSKLASVFESLPNRVLFSFFNGESWGYVGSRMFLADIASFQCDKDATAPSVGCAQPFRPDLNFTRLRINDIQSVFELNQVALSNTLYLHRERDGNGQTTSMQNTLTDAAINTTGITLGNPAADTPGVPPSSTLSFIKAKPGVAATVLTDHSREYINKYFHSRFDDNSYVINAAVQTTPVTSCPLCQRLCNIATFTARSLYSLAGGSNINLRNTIQANCTEVTELVDCLTKNFECDLVKNLLTDFRHGSVTVPPLNYANVYRIQRRNTISGTPRFIYEFLTNFAKNSGVAAYNGSAHYHDAVDPALKFDYSSTKWKIINTTISPVWTESSWSTNIGTRAYRRENPTIAWIMLGLGLGLTALTAGLLHLISGYCQSKFKVI